MNENRTRPAVRILLVMLLAFAAEVAAIVGLQPSPAQAVAACAVWAATFLALLRLTSPRRAPNSEHNDH
jgi:hypothetical protein